MRGEAHRRAIACMLVCAAVAKIDDEMLHHTLIREGVKVWLSEMSPDEVEQIASMELGRLTEYVAQHACDDINSRYNAHPDDPAERDDAA
jgi:hypothetical protein